MKCFFLKKGCVPWFDDGGSSLGIENRRIDSRNLPATGQNHGLNQFASQLFQVSFDAGLQPAHRCDGKGTTDHDGICTQGQQFECVSAGADSAVDQDGG